MGAERQMQITLELTNVLPSLRPEILILEFLEDATAVVAQSDQRVIHVASLSRRLKFLFLKRKLPRLPRRRK